MPKVGKEEFDYTTEGMAEAEAFSEATGIPISNALDRVQNYQLGGLVDGGQMPGGLGRGGQLPALGASVLGRGQPMPGDYPRIPPTNEFNKGGKVHKKGYKK